MKIKDLVLILKDLPQDSEVKIVQSFYDGNDDNYVLDDPDVMITESDDIILLSGLNIKHIKYRYGGLTLQELLRDGYERKRLWGDD